MEHTANKIYGIYKASRSPVYSILAVLGMLHTWAQSAFYIQWPPNLATIKYTSSSCVLPHFQGFTSSGIERGSLILRIFLSVIAVITSSMKLCRVGKHNTIWHINVNYVEIFCIYTWSVKLNIVWIWEWGTYGLSGWGIYCLNGLWSYEKVRYYFGVYAQKPWVFDELILADSKKQRRSLDLSVEYHKYKSGML